jgi:hypothetical protein
MDISTVAFMIASKAPALKKTRDKELHNVKEVC